jgi:type I restriction enzyme R subunit
LEPDARSRRVFSFHRSDTLDQWLAQELQHSGSTLRAKLRTLPELITDGLRPAQITAIRNLEAFPRTRSSPCPHPDGQRRR